MMVGPTIPEGVAAGSRPAIRTTVVGLTGNVAAGKSTVASLWREWGVPVVSADELARATVEPGSEGLAEVVRVFGVEAVSPDGSLDRAGMRARVFGDDDARRRLEAIIHPRVKDLRDAWTREQAAAGAPLVVWEVPLLVETGMDRDVDIVVVVDAPTEVRIGRMMERRGLSRDQAEAIMQAQLAAEDVRSRADLVIDNDSDEDELRDRARATLEAIQAYEPESVA